MNRFFSANCLVHLPLLSRQGILEIGVYSFVTKAVQTAVFFIAQVFASRLLSRNDFGDAQYILWLSTFSWMLFHLGIPSLFARYFPLIAAGERIQLLKRGTFLLLITLLLALVFSWFQISAHRMQLWLLTAVLVVAHAINAFLSTAAIGLMQNRQLFKAQIPAAVVLFVWMYMHRETFTTVAYLQAMVLFYVVYSVLLGVVVKLKSVPAFDEKKHLPTTWPLVKISLAFYASALLAALVWQRSEVYVLGRWFSTGILADYTVALTLTALFTEPVRWVTSAYTAYFAGSKKSEKFYLKLHTLSWSITCFLSVFACFFAQQFVELIYGSHYAQAAVYMQWLIPFVAIGVSSYPTMSLHTGLGKTRFLLLQDGSTALLFIGMLVFTVVQQDVYFLFYAKGAAIIFSVITGMLYTHTQLKVNYRIKDLVWPVVLSAVVYVVWQLAHVLSFVPALMLAAFTFVAYAWLLIKAGCISLQVK